METSTDINSNEDLISRFFNKDSLIEMVYEKIVSKKHCAIGLDAADKNHFMRYLNDEIDIILRKISDGSYKFTRYRMMLIPKGPKKNPRRICVPTIRDRLVIAVISQILKNKFESARSRPRPDQVIRQIVKEKGRFSTYIKLDLSTFYASINHKLLLDKLKVIGNPTVLKLIERVITTPAYDPETDTESKIETEAKPGSPSEPVGVPEGLSCSGLLADIFLEDIDCRYGKREDIRYYRFVDDILILCDKEEDETEQLKKQIISDLTAKKLIINQEKTKTSQLIDGLSYLGYTFSGDFISVRKESIRKHEKAIEDMVKKYVKKITNTDTLYKAVYSKYELDNKISMLCTGANVEDTFMGWMSYYRYITNMKLLYHFDWLITSLYNRYNIPKYCGKRHVRAYHELNRNIKNTTYVFKYRNLKAYNDSKKDEFLKTARQSLKSGCEKLSAAAKTIHKTGGTGGLIKSSDIKDLKLQNELKLNNNQKAVLSLGLSKFVSVKNHDEYNRISIKADSDFSNILSTFKKKNWLEFSQKEIDILLSGITPKTEAEEKSNKNKDDAEEKYVSRHDESLQDSTAETDEMNQNVEITAAVNDTDENNEKQGETDQRQEEKDFEKPDNEQLKSQLAKYAQIIERISREKNILIDDYAFLSGIDKNGDMTPEEIIDAIIGEFLTDPIIEEDLKTFDYE
jgi:retron-type reverse transcriptase